MELNSNSECKDGDPVPQSGEAPSIVDISKQKYGGTAKKKRRRGKSKRKVMKPYLKTPWLERRKNDKNKRKNRFRKIVLAKTHAPFNNNQFLMEIHKPEPENNFHLARTPSARTRDSSFSVDSEDNYFYSLPEDEEEYLTKEFSSVYEDAQSERLSNMSKDDLIQEYLLLEAKYENLIKRTERKQHNNEDEKYIETTEKELSLTDKDSMITDKDMSGTSVESSTTEEPSVSEILQQMKEQEEQIRELQIANEKLVLENQHLRQRSQCISSEDSESDSSTTSISSSSCSSRSMSPVNEPKEASNCELQANNHSNNLPNGDIDEVELDYHLPNGFHNANDE